MAAMSGNYTQPMRYRDTGHLQAGQMSRWDMSRSLGICGTFGPGHFPSPLRGGVRMSRMSHYNMSIL